MVALLVIDMQVGSFVEPMPRHDAEGVVQRINALAEAVRASGGAVIFIQHDGPAGTPFEPGSDGWRLLPTLRREADDIVVHKRACDAFCETDLASVFAERALTRAIVSGCATDFCVDTTVRAALSLDYDVTVVEDGHTTADRPHADAATLIRHHNWVWENLIHPRRSVRVVPAERIVSEMREG